MTHDALRSLLAAFHNAVCVLEAKRGDCSIETTTFDEPSTPLFNESGGWPKYTLINLCSQACRHHQRRTSTQLAEHERPIAAL